MRIIRLILRVIEAILKNREAQVHQSARGPVAVPKHEKVVYYLYEDKSGTSSSGLKFIYMAPDNSFCLEKFSTGETNVHSYMKLYEFRSSVAESGSPEIRLLESSRSVGTYTEGETVYEVKDGVILASNLVEDGVWPSEARLDSFRRELKWHRHEDPRVGALLLLQGSRGEIRPSTRQLVRSEIERLKLGFHQARSSSEIILRKRGYGFSWKYTTQETPSGEYAEARNASFFQERFCISSYELFYLNIILRDLHGFLGEQCDQLAI
ncbi:MAG: hypothetical protein IPJ84_15275 [Bdellovibrionales bacterium]|nr:hypothetical protein [Bdellovibrionales bacterium]